MALTFTAVDNTFVSNDKKTIASLPYYACEVLGGTINTSTNPGIATITTDNQPIDLTKTTSITFDRIIRNTYFNSGSYVNYNIFGYPELVNHFVAKNNCSIGLVDLNNPKTFLVKKKLDVNGWVFQQKKDNPMQYTVTIDGKNKKLTVCMNSFELRYFDFELAIPDNNNLALAMEVQTFFIRNYSYNYYRNGGYSYWDSNNVEYIVFKDQFKELILDNFSYVI